MDFYPRAKAIFYRKMYNNCPFSFGKRFTENLIRLTHLAEKIPQKESYIGVHLRIIEKFFL
jgi:hypothetical protein